MSKPILSMFCAFSDALCVVVFVQNPHTISGLFCLWAAISNVLIMTWYIIDTAGED